MPPPINQLRRAETNDAVVPQFSRSAYPHELLDRVQDILSGDFEVDSSELVQVLRGIGSTEPNMRVHAASLAESFRPREVPPPGDTTRKDLVAILMMILRHRSNIPKLHRKVKSFVFSKHVDALRGINEALGRRPGECVALNLEAQEDLLHRALACGGISRVEHNDSVAARQLIDSVLEEIRDTDVKRSLNQQFAAAARKRLRDTRQMVDCRCYEEFFVIHDDVIDMVVDEGESRRDKAEKIAQWRWNNLCFRLTIFHTNRSDEGTQAEFLAKWLRAGYTWKSSIAHLRTLKVSRPKREREVSPTFRHYTMKKVCQKLARDHASRARTLAEAGGSSS